MPGSPAWLCEFCLLGEFVLRLELFLCLWKMAGLAFLPTDEKGSVACKLEFLSWKRSVFKYSTEDWF